jgi:hypothetical protein
MHNARLNYPFSTDDIDYDRSVVGIPQIVHRVPANLPIHLRAQHKWLSRNVMHGRIKVSQQQIGPLQTRLVDNVVAFR